MAALASDWLRHFRLLLWNRWAEFNETWHEARHLRPLPSLCFSFRSEKQDGRPCLWLAETFSTSLKMLSEIQRNFTGSKISTSSTKFVFYGSISKQKWLPKRIPQKGGTLYSGARYVALWASCFPIFITAYPGLTWNLCAQFDDWRMLKRKYLCAKTIFSNQCIVTFTFDLLTPKSLGHICNSRAVFLWSCMMLDIKRSSYAQKAFSRINALWPWPLNPKIKRAHPQLMGSLCMKFHDDNCKWEANTTHTQFSVINAI